MGRLLAGCLLAGIVLGVTGCVTSQGDFTVMSTKLVNLNQFDLEAADRQRNIVGEDKAHIIIIFPTKLNTNLKTAVDNALEKGGGDVLTDGRLETFGWYIPLIYGQTGWRVRGDVVKTRGKDRMP